MAGKKKEPGIHMMSLVSARTKEPLVEMEMVENGGESVRGQLGMSQAMAHVLNVLNSMAAAQVDAFLLAFLTDANEMNMSIDDGMNVIVAFRRWRKLHEDLPDGLRDHVVRAADDEVETPPKAQPGHGCARCGHTAGWHTGHGASCTAGGCLCESYVPIEVQP